MTYRITKSLPLIAVPVLLLAAGCEDDREPVGGTAGPGGGTPAAAQFTLAWSEYPSWSVFGVAEQKGLIDGEAGAMGSLEEKHGVDIVLRNLDYDTCLTQYANGQLDAVCITNIDVLPLAGSVPSVAVLPTSTSNGADAVIVTGDINTITDLKGVEAKGLEKSVSEYTFRRGLEVSGEDPDEYTFSNLDPAAAATAMQAGDDGVKAIVVWNPFVLQTLNTTPDARRLFDSSLIPGEIVDMVVVTEAALAQPGGEAFVAAFSEAFYAVSADLQDDSDQRQATLGMLGGLFGGLTADEMAVVTKETEFYDTPARGVEVMESAELKRATDRVVQFAQDRGLLEGDAPNIAFGDGGDDVGLRFQPSYLSGMAGDGALPEPE